MKSVYRNLDGIGNSTVKGPELGLKTFLGPQPLNLVCHGSYETLVATLRYVT